MKKIVVLLLSVLFVSMLGCQAADVATTEVEPIVEEGPVAFTISGNVATEFGWSEAEIKSLNTLDVDYTNKDGETTTYTGVLLSDLLTLAQPGADAANLVFVADDGYTAEVALADVMTCTNCILGFREEGGFISVMPDFSGKLQVKGIVEIQVQ